jgi:hypothetical protein
MNATPMMNKIGPTSKLSTNRIGPVSKQSMNRVPTQRDSGNRLGPTSKLSTQSIHTAGDAFSKKFKLGSGGVFGGGFQTGGQMHGRFF